MHVLFIILANSSKGGTQYAATRLAGHMLNRGHRVTLAYADDFGKAFGFPSPASLDLLPYSRSQEHANICRLREELRSMSPDVCLCMHSTRDHLLWAVASLGTGIPFIYSERTSPYIMASPPRWNSAGRLAAISGADAVHLLMPEYAETVPACFRDRVRVIGNPAPSGIIRYAEPTTQQEGRFRLISLGRLVESKQPFLLAKAFAHIAHAMPEWDLHFWGNGEEEAALTEFVRRHSELRNRLFLHGNTDRPLEVYPTGHLYCSASRYEGFPNAVLEALACGLPVVGFAGCTGLNGLVRHDVNGLLAQEMTVASLAEVLLRLMRDVSLRERLGQEARRVRKYYAEDVIFAQWEKLFYEMARRKNATVMDAFTKEPFASRARLSAAARREWLFRDFGMPMPYSMPWWKQRVASRLRAAGLRIAWWGRERFDSIRALPTLAAHARRARPLLESGNFAHKQYVFRQLYKTIRMLPLQHPGRTENFIEYVCEHVSVRNISVCCIGCRDAKELEAWKKRSVRKVTGVDLISTHPDIRIMDMHHMSFPDNSFDVVYACHALEHAANPPAAIDEFVRVVRDKGYIALELPTHFIKNNVDLHVFDSLDAIRELFSRHYIHCVSEEYLPRSSKLNSSGNDIFRSIYQIKK
jgi:glycosyltransferase involved in cell wall biosynthesis